MVDYPFHLEISLVTDCNMHITQHCCFHSAFSFVSCPCKSSVHKADLSMVKSLCSNKHTAQTLSLQACEKHVPAIICPLKETPLKNNEGDVSPLYSICRKVITQCGFFSEPFITSIHPSLEYLVSSFPIKYLPLCHSLMFSLPSTEKNFL